WGRVRRIARIKPQGITVPVLIGELLPPESEPGPNLTEMNRRMYEAALERFLVGDWIGFGRMTANFPPDGPLRFLKRYADEMHGTPPDGWDAAIPVAK
ncbi:MAG: adenylate/guanylate cyclase domain-containing protein, partial [Fimbriiglobus sp.]